MNKLGKFRFAGGRIVKTGVAVFITAFICTLLGLPVIFAAITAIVSIEPTTSDSIKKGFIRLPATAIGAVVSIIFFYMFGDSAFTYAFAAMITIFICHNLKLHEGALVATLTAVAMVPDIEGNLLLMFLTRVATTSIGLTVATVVNLLLFPPEFLTSINNKLNKLYSLSGEILNESIMKLIAKEMVGNLSEPYLKLREGIEEVVKLSKYQKAEWKYRRGTMKDYRQYTILQKKIAFLQRIILHIGNLQYLSAKIDFSEEEEKMLKEITQLMTSILTDEFHSIPDGHYLYIDELDTRYKYENNDQLSLFQGKYHHHFPPKTVVYYELLALHDTLEELEQLMKKCSG